LNSPFIDRRSYESLRRKNKASLAAYAYRGEILSASPWLREEILHLQEALSIPKAMEANLPSELVDCHIGDLEVTCNEFEEHEYERLWTFITEDPEVLAAVEDLALRYDFPLAWFFQSYLLNGMAPSSSDLSKHLEGMFNTSSVSQRMSSAVGTLRVETDPPNHDIDVESQGLAKLAGWRRRNLRKLKIVVGPRTTLDDIGSLWPYIEKMQERLLGYPGPRRRPAKDLERDLRLFDLIQNQKFGHAKAVEEWNKLHPESEFDADLSRVSALLRRLRREMKPRWSKSAS
jgi:hypothetical protein